MQALIPQPCSRACVRGGAVRQVQGVQDLPGSPAESAAHPAPHQSGLCSHQAPEGTCRWVPSPGLASELPPQEAPVLIAKRRRQFLSFIFSPLFFLSLCIFWYLLFFSLYFDTLPNMKESVRSMALLVIDQDTGNPGVSVPSWLAEDVKPLSPHLCLEGVVTTIMTVPSRRALRTFVVFVCNG